MGFEGLGVDIRVWLVLSVLGVKGGC